MIKASSLYIVIVITLVIGMLCFSIISIAYYQRLQVQKNHLIKRLHDNAESGVNLLLGDYDKILLDEPITLDLYGEERDSVLVKKSSWGIYEVASVKAFSGVFNTVKSALYGYTIDPQNKIALYLSDQNLQLCLSGKASIKGSCYLPEAGVKSQPMEGVDFTSDKLVHGEIKKSKLALPELNKNITQELLKQFPIFIVKEENEIIPAGEKDTLIQSFHESGIIVNASSIKALSKKHYEGNIILYSHHIIEIDSSCQLNDIIIFAPAIIFKKGFKGSLQAFCSDSIIVMENCHLNYPSALGLIKKDFRVQQPFIRIKEESEISGVFFSYTDVNDLRKTLISIDKKALVKGQVYSDGFLELKGEINGSTYCQKFYLETPSARYDNFILNGTIDYTKLSSHYVGSNLIGSTKHKKIVKWLE